MKDKDQISDDELRNALIRSGYLLETRVARVFQDRSTYVEPSSVYLDPTGEASRELDVFAMDGTEVSNIGYIFSVHLVECVNNPQPFALFTYTAAHLEYFAPQRLHYAGLPIKIHNRKRELPLLEFLAGSKGIPLHYKSGTVATQYCSFKRKAKNDKEWMAFHEDAHFGSIHALCSAVEHRAKLYYDGFRRGPKEKLNIEFYYPILVLQGPLLTVKQTPDFHISPAEHAGLLQTTFFGQREQSYQIDVVTEEYLPSLLDTIRQEQQTIAEMIRDRRRQIMRAVTIISAALDAPNANARQIMELSK
ncbi:MAG: hypothetical protein ABSB74_00590 [Tepidisphaeraceae bacterium]